MRPLPGDEAWTGRQRRAERDTVPLMSSGGASHQMSFFVADEATVDAYLEQPSLPRVRDPRKAADSGIRPSTGKDDQDAGPLRPSSRQRERRSHGSLGHSPMSRTSHTNPSPISMRSATQPSLSRPMTPMGTSCTGSVMSTPSSIRDDSRDGSIHSDDEIQPSQHTSGMMDSGSAPQLVMPSIKMPSRRPFTERGKNMGRLKALIAGDSGTGKTSLIKAIVQTCEHIVHVDPITPRSVMKTRSLASNGFSRRAPGSVIQISEIFASTKPYPEWWAELGESHASHKRKSMGDNVLDRNICFVDTQGYSAGSSAMDTIEPCVEYVEAHLQKVLRDSLNESDLLNMLGGDGGFQVDVVFYLIRQGVKPADVEYLRRLAPLTNIVPLLAQADRLSVEELVACKQRIASQLQDAGIRTFSFTTEDVPGIPYAVSSATGSDDEVMDASLLMSPDYVQPLVRTELATLVERVFSPDGCSWLRHSAAKKYLLWRKASSSSRPKDLYRPLTCLEAPMSSALTRSSGAIVGSVSSPVPSYNYLDDDQARIHMVAWAAELQHSLAKERAHFEGLARNERAVWLSERLNECIKDGALVPTKESNRSGKVRRRRRTRQCFSKMPPYHQDPLGLLQVAADLRSKSRAALELLASLTVLGGLAYWIGRQRRLIEPVEFADEWMRFCGVDL